jgi:exportin-1
MNDLSLILSCLLSSFSHSAQVQQFVVNLAEYHSDLNRFKLALRDFLIQLKEFSAGDNTELFLEEKELEAKEREQTERAAAARIPGMLKPSQMEDDKDEDL